MATAFSANKQLLELAPTPVLARFAWRLMANLRGGLAAPEMGAKPKGLCVPDAWQCNSALLMSLYERDRS